MKPYCVHSKRWSSIAVFGREIWWRVAPLRSLYVSLTTYILSGHFYLRLAQLGHLIMAFGRLPSVWSEAAIRYMEGLAECGIGLLWRQQQVRKKLHSGRRHDNPKKKQRSSLSAVAWVQVENRCSRSRSCSTDERSTRLSWSSERLNTYEYVLTQRAPTGSSSTRQGCVAVCFGRVAVLGCAICSTLQPIENFHKMAGAWVELGSRHDYGVWWCALICNSELEGGCVPTHIHWDINIGSLYQAGLAHRSWDDLTLVGLLWVFVCMDRVR